MIGTVLAAPNSTWRVRTQIPTAREHRNILYTGFTVYGLQIYVQRKQSIQRRCIDDSAQVAVVCENVRRFLRGEQLEVVAAILPMYRFIGYLHVSELKSFTTSLYIYIYFSKNTVTDYSYQFANVI